MDWSPFLCLLLHLVVTVLSRTVETTLGPVVGERISTVDNRYNLPIFYDSFYALPFAAPPLGEARFSKPQPATPWSEPRNATQAGAPVHWLTVCYQVGGLIPFSSEDCLYLNVHVPVTQDDNPLPVMVWLTGGAFLVGGGPWYGPDFWMTHNIIVVTVNYRVGPSGFLTLGMEEAPGNAGLWDQAAALQWVQDNIAAFGGDPGRVTLAGESAGSFSSFYHLSSPTSRGLFQRLIGQSGVGGLAPGYHQWSPEEGFRLGNQIAILLGCIEIDPNQRLSCLRNVSAPALSLVELEDGIISMPVIDSEWTDNPFFPTYPEVAFQEGNFHTEVDILLGSNGEEGLLGTQIYGAIPDILPTIMNNWGVWGPILLFQRKALSISEDDIELADFLLDQYTGKGRNMTIEDIPALTDLLTDAFFNFGIDRYLDYHLEHSSGRIYQYVNEHRNEYEQLNWAAFLGGPKHLPGTSHADELFLQWSPLLGIHIHLPETDVSMSKLITSTWASFVTSGDPTPPGSEISWSQVTADAREYLTMVNGTGTMGRSQEWVRRSEIWRNIFGGRNNYQEQR